MAKEDSDAERNSHIARIGNAVGDDDQQILLTEYEQAGAEARTRERLIHNGYYIFITITAVLLWRGLQLESKQNWRGMELLLIGGGALYVLLGLVIIEHFRRRRAAWNIRGRVQKLFAGEFEHLINSNSEKEKYANSSGPIVEHPLSLQYHMVGKNVVWAGTTERNEDEENSQTEGPDLGFAWAPGLFKELLSGTGGSFYSAKFVGRSMIWIGLSAGIGGVLIYMRGPWWAWLPASLVVTLVVYFVVTLVVYCPYTRRVINIINWF